MDIVVDDEHKLRFPAWWDTGRTVLRIDNGDSAIGVLARQWHLYLRGLDNPIQDLWLDHDLGASGDIGSVVDFLIDIATAHGGHVSPTSFISNIYVHSLNSGAAGQMVRSLRKSGYNVQTAAQPWTLRKPI